MGNSFQSPQRKRRQSEVEGDGVGFVHNDNGTEVDLDEGRVFFCKLRVEKKNTTNLDTRPLEGNFFNHNGATDLNQQSLTLVGRAYRSKGRYFDDTHDMNVVFDFHDNDISLLQAKEYMKGQRVEDFQDHLWKLEPFAQYSKKFNFANETKIEDAERLATVTYRAMASQATEITFPLAATQVLTPDLPTISAGVGIELIQNVYNREDPVTRVPTHVNAIWHVKDVETITNDFDTSSRRGVVLPALTSRYYLSRLDISYPYHAMSKWILHRLKQTLYIPPPIDANPLPSAPPLQQSDLDYGETSRKRQKLMPPEANQFQVQNQPQGTYLFPNTIRFDVPFKSEPEFP